MGKLKTIKYKQHEFGCRPNLREGTLLTFVYDIPYFAACGIFPPLHVVNQIFAEGGSAGGMSPGTSWKPFTLSQDEYEELVEAIRNTPIAEIKPYARFAWVPMEFDSEFDHIQDRFQWMGAMCDKHRENWHTRLQEKET